MSRLGTHAPLRSRYRFEAEIGRGAVGIVYSARDEARGERVAIKLTAKRATVSPRVNLMHEHIVRIAEQGTDGNCRYAVMEYVGNDLSAYTDPATRLPLHITQSIARSVADALAYAHEHGYVHGDVKPANVLYSALKQTVKLADFTAADAANARGTPAYRAPDQICGGGASAAADQFSFGVMFYQLLGGALPFTAHSLPELCFKTVHCAHVDVRQHEPAVSASLARLIDRTLAKDPAARFASMRDIVVALRKAA